MASNDYFAIGKLSKVSGDSIEYYIPCRNVRTWRFKQFLVPYDSLEVVNFFDETQAKNCLLTIGTSCNILGSSDLFIASLKVVEGEGMGQVSFSYCPI